MRHSQERPAYAQRLPDLVGKQNINVEHLVNAAKGEYAYSIIELGEKVNRDLADSIAAWTASSACGLSNAGIVREL